MFNRKAAIRVICVLLAVLMASGTLTVLLSLFGVY